MHKHMQQQGRSLLCKMCYQKGLPSWPGGHVVGDTSSHAFKVAALTGSVLHTDADVALLLCRFCCAVMWCDVDVQCIWTVASAVEQAVVRSAECSEPAHCLFCSLLKHLA